MKKYRLLHLPTGRYVQTDIKYFEWRDHPNTICSKYKINRYFEDVTFGLEGLWDDDVSKCDKYFLELPSEASYTALFKRAHLEKVGFNFHIAFDLKLTLDSEAWYEGNQKVPIVRDEFEIIKVTVIKQD